MPLSSELSHAKIHNSAKKKVNIFIDLFMIFNFYFFIDKLLHNLQSFFVDRFD
jgi:hypothetical protein